MTIVSKAGCCSCSQTLLVPTPARGICRYTIVILYGSLDETPTYMAAFAMRGVSPLVNPFVPCSLHSCRTIAPSVGL